MRLERYQIGNVSISKANLQNSLEVLSEALLSGECGYVCICNARTTFLANHNIEYCRVQNNSLLTLPDGMPLVWIAHNQNHKDVQKCSGKDLMEKLFEVSVANGHSHYFYGCSTRTIERMLVELREKYKGIEIKAAVSPPFQPIEKFDIDALAKDINSLAPSFFWCGLGAPKQEELIALLQPKLNNTICLGVGLAFEYFAGTVKRAPVWMQNYGLEGFVRLVQQPKRINSSLLKRYIHTIAIVIKSFFTTRI